MIIKLDNEFFLVVGTATKDAEVKTVGEKQTAVCQFSIAAGKRKDTTTIFLDIKAWRGLAFVAGAARKGDSIAAIGKLEEREWNGKTYKSIVCEWLNICKQSASQSANLNALMQNPAVNSSAETAVVSAAASPSFASELQEASEELPF